MGAENIAVFTVCDAVTGEIIYIGAGNNIDRMYRELMNGYRIAKHGREYIKECREKEALPKMRVLKWFPSRETANSMRNKLIAHYKPMLNRYAKPLRERC